MSYKERFYSVAIYLSLLILLAIQSLIVFPLIGMYESFRRLKFKE